MSTITEDINKVIQIKNDLNSILLENGLDGGRVFEDYPEKFRELFRILQDQTEEVVDEYTGPNEIETFVAKPEISWFENVVTITCATQGATIYYMVKSESGNYDKGYGPYMNKFYIKEDVYVEAFARYNGVDSTVSSVNIPFYKGQVPDNPVIVRDGTTVTITCTGTYTSIWWSTVNGNYVQYTGPVTVQRTEDVYAYSTYNRFASDIVKDEAPEQIIIPEVPTIDCTLNIITMETETENATIYYMIKGDDEWIEYEGAIEIFESGYYRAKAVLNGIESFATNYVYCEYIAAPDEPEITCSNNTVTIEAENGAVIYYRFEGDEDWILYDEPFVISETVTVEAYCHKDGLDSDAVSVECEYVAPQFGVVGSCSISNNNNLITITCSQTPDATIYYCVSATELEHMDDLSQYSIYEGPFYITENSHIYAHAVKPPYNANSWTHSYFIYVEPVEPPSDRLPVPVISCNNNIVFIATSIEGGAIYYKKVNDNEYHLYTGGIPITETTTFFAFVSKDDKTSDIISQECTYVEPSVIKPAAPVITCIDNTVNMTTSTEGAVIYYRKNNTEDIYAIFTGSFNITETTTYQAYSYKDNQISDIITYTCLYDDPDAGEGYNVIIDPASYSIPLSIKMRENGYIDYVINHSYTYGPNYGYGRFIYIKYKINDGDWHITEANEYTNTWNDSKGNNQTTKLNRIYLNANDVISFSVSRFGWDSGIFDSWYPGKPGGWFRPNFIIKGRCKIYGNLMSLFWESESYWDYHDSYYFQNGAMWNLFMNSDIEDANDLVLPLNNTSSDAYREMFMNNSKLINPPRIADIDLSIYSTATGYPEYMLRSMFEGCLMLVEDKYPKLPKNYGPENNFYRIFQGTNIIQP